MINTERCHTIDSRIAKDILRSMNNLSSEYFIEGGMALQNYIPNELHRKTEDIDLAVLAPISNASDMKSVFSGVFDSLKDNGYNVSVHKRRKTIDAVINREEGYELSELQLQVPRMSEGRYGKMKGYLEKELSLSNKIYGLNVTRPDRIVADKLDRVWRIFDNYGIVHVNNDNNLKNWDVENCKKRAVSFWEHLPESELVEYKSINDTYDIRSLMQNMEIDMGLVEANLTESYRAVFSGKADAETLAKHNTRKAMSMLEVIVPKQEH